MCGIVGFTGRQQAAPILLDGLEKLEYRGYDSAGIAVAQEGAAGYGGAARGAQSGSRQTAGAARPEAQGERPEGSGAGSTEPSIEIVKAKGRLKVLREMTDDGRSVPGTCGIGHTRWATHGEPSVVNSHPHYAKNKRVAVVHNGIIENYQEIRDRLTKEGFSFLSETDTESVAHLLDKYYAGNPIEAISKVMFRVRGSYALGILFADRPGEIYAVRKDSPLIVGRSDQGNFIASDVPAILKYTRDVCFIPNLEIVKLTAAEIHFYNVDQEEVEETFSAINWDTEAAEKGGFAHFMLKEIYEQPKAVRDTVSPRISEGHVNLEELGMSREELAKVSRIQMVACGSAYHVCMTAKYMVEQTARVPVDVDLASEFRYRNPVMEKDTLVVVVSQSGETADSLAALREAKKLGYRVLGIVNVVGSSIAREADSVFYTWAGPEISVATTKAYSTQLAAVYLLAIGLGRAKGVIGEAAEKEMTAELLRLPEKIERILEEKERIQWFANKFSHSKDIFFIGRGLDYASSLEGSLKLKEISYIHSEAYAAGELKHGTISLIEDGILVVGVATQKSLFEKLISNMVEVKSRGAYVLGVTSYGNYSMEDVANYTIYVPKTMECFAASLTVVPLQLLAYYVALGKGLDVDKPRNLAKSVTVE